MGADLRPKRRSPDGVDVSAPTFEDTGGVYPQWRGFKYVAIAGVTNIFDVLITTEKQIRGGWYELLDANAIIGDRIEFAVVDKDDVLGLFGMYGLTVGQDVLELKKYVRDEYVNPARNDRQVFMARSTFVITAGLYTRTIYESTGSNDVTFKVVTLVYE